MFVVPSLERRKLLHLHATPHQTAQRTEQQMGEAFPWEATERYLRRIPGSYGRYYNRSRTRFALAKDAPDPRGGSMKGAWER